QPEAELQMNSADLQARCKALLDDKEYSIWHYGVEGYNDEEIARKLDLSPKTVANKKSMIKKRLKDQLTNL
ncbi:MAG: LuxR C-terminal-related transcriptional regulator, partial [Bacteroidota bacterium]